MRPLLRVLGYFKPYSRLAAATLLCAVLSTLTALAPPYLVRTVIDDALGSGSLSRLLLYVALIGAAYLVRDLFNSLRIRFNNRLEQKVILDMRNEAFQKMQRLSLGFYAD